MCCRCYKSCDCAREKECGGEIYATQPNGGRTRFKKPLQVSIERNLDNSVSLECGDNLMLIPLDVWKRLVSFVW